MRSAQNKKKAAARPTTASLKKQLHILEHRTEVFQIIYKRTVTEHKADNIEYLNNKLYLRIKAAQIDAKTGIAQIHKPQTDKTLGRQHKKSGNYVKNRLNFAALSCSNGNALTDSKHSEKILAEFPVHYKKKNHQRHIRTHGRIK